MSFIILPISFIDVSISMDEPSSPIGFIIYPVAFIEWKILPYLFTSAISHAILKLTYVDRVVFESDRSFGNVLTFFVIIIFKRP